MLESYPPKTEVLIAIWVETRSWKLLVDLKMKVQTENALGKEIDFCLSALQKLHCMLVDSR